jgi:hypothetical protein
MQFFKSLHKLLAAASPLSDIAAADFLFSILLADQVPFLVAAAVGRILIHLGAV